MGCNTLLSYIPPHQVEEKIEKSEKPLRPEKEQKPEKEGGGGDKREGGVKGEGGAKKEGTDKKEGTANGGGGSGSGSGSGSGHSLTVPIEGKHQNNDTWTKFDSQSVSSQCSGPLFECLSSTPASNSCPLFSSCISAVQHLRCTFPLNAEHTPLQQWQAAAEHWGLDRSSVSKALRRFNGITHTQGFEFRYCDAKLAFDVAAKAAAAGGAMLPPLPLGRAPAWPAAHRDAAQVAAGKAAEAAAAAAAAAAAKANPAALAPGGLTGSETPESGGGPGGANQGTQSPALPPMAGLMAAPAAAPVAAPAVDGASAQSVLDVLNDSIHEAMGG